MSKQAYQFNPPLRKTNYLKVLGWAQDVPRVSKSYENEKFQKLLNII